MLHDLHDLKRYFFHITVFKFSIYYKFDFTICYILIRKNFSFLGL